jgi:hypothetical protein
MLPPATALVHSVFHSHRNRARGFGALYFPHRTRHLLRYPTALLPSLQARPPHSLIHLETPITVRYGTVSSPPSSPSRPPDPDHAGTHQTQRRSAPPSVRSSHATKDRRLFPQTWKTKHQSTHYGQRERKKYPCTIESCRQYPDGGCGQRNTHKTRRNK